MTDIKLTDQQRKLLCDLVQDEIGRGAFAVTRAGTSELVELLKLISGVDTVIVAKKA